MSIDSEAMGQVFYHAAIEVGQGRRISVQTALVAACIRLQKDDPHQAIYGPSMWKECMKVARLMYNGEGYHNTDPWFARQGGFSGGGKFWLSEETKSWLVIFLLFCYEWIVSEISGGQGRIPEIVTPRNTEETCLTL